MSKNQTYAFLSPVLNTYPKTHLNALVALEIEGIYLEHCQYTELHDLSIKPYLYIKVKNNTNTFKQINVLKTSKYYIDNYLESLEGDYSIIVLKVPEKFENAWFKFIQSKFSSMYTREQLESIGEIENSKSSLPAMIVLKSPLARDIFKSDIFKKFGTELKDSEITGEYCMPLDIKKEVLNYCQETSADFNYLNTLSINQ